MRAARTALATAAAVAVLLGGTAQGQTPAPALSVSTTALASALHCTGDLASSERQGLRPVLLLHGTTSDPRSDFSWNWDKAFDAQRRAHCEVELPDSGNSDIQTAAEYVVYGIRTMAAAAHGKISLLGHSQGGMIGRWALKYWPDTRSRVDDYVGLSGSNHGTQVFDAQCLAARGCSAANWQQSTSSHFLAALNSGPQTWPGISYTEISTAYDEVVVPYSSAFLPHATNLTVQQLCSTEVVDHFGMSYDNAAYLLGMDAFTHAGPAVLSRVSTATCGQPFMPAVNPALFPTNVAGALAQTADSSATAANLPREPALRCYVTRTCR